MFTAVQVVLDQPTYRPLVPISLPSLMMRRTHSIMVVLGEYKLDLTFSSKTSPSSYVAEASDDFRASAFGALRLASLTPGVAFYPQPPGYLGLGWLPKTKKIQKFTDPPYGPT